jgi:hypothetical protein
MSRVKLASKHPLEQELGHADSMESGQAQEEAHKRDYKLQLLKGWFSKASRGKTTNFLHRPVCSLARCDTPKASQYLRLGLDTISCNKKENDSNNRDDNVDNVT